MDEKLSDKIAIVFVIDDVKYFLIIQILDKRNPARPYPNFG